MVQQQYTTKRRKGQHLTLIERGKIEAFLKINIPKTQIASEIGISIRTLYREINRGMVRGLLNSDYSTYDAYSAEFAHKKYLESMKSKEGSLKIGGRSIEERPEEINNRQEVGHFEVDPVVGKRGTKEAILVLTERKTRLEIIRKIPDKTAESVIKELSKIITEYPGVIKSITSDNGSEFMRADKVEEENIAYYYAHSYSS